MSVKNNLTANSFRTDDNDPVFNSGNFSAKYIKNNNPKFIPATNTINSEGSSDDNTAPVTISGGFNKAFASEFNESTPLGVSLNNNNNGRESLLSMSLSNSLSAARLRNNINSNSHLNMNSTPSNNSTPAFPTLSTNSNNNDNQNFINQSNPSQHMFSPQLNPVISAGSARSPQVITPDLVQSDSDCQSFNQIHLNAEQHIRNRNHYNTKDTVKNDLLEIMNLYGRFAGEDLREDENEDEEEDTDESYFESSDDKKSSNFKAFLLLLKAFLGTGIIFLPKAMSNGGLLFSNLMIVSFSIVSYYCFVILIETTKKCGVSGYGDIGEQIFGKGVQFLILLSLALSQLGFASTYVVFVSKNLQQILKEDYTIGFFIILQCVVFTPISLTRSISKLGFFALIADVFIFLGLMYIYLESSKNLILNGFSEKVEMFKRDSWTLFIGTAVFTYEGIGLLIPIQESMKEPEKFNKLLLYVMIIVTIVFTTIATISYLSFGDDIHTIVLMDFPQVELTILIETLYCMAILLSTPIQLFPAIKIIENYLFSQHRGTWKNKIRRNSEAISIISNPSQTYDSISLRHASQTANFNLINDDGLISGKSDIFIKTMKNLLRVSIVLLMCCIAYLGSSKLDKFVSLIGSLTCVPLIYIYPPLLYTNAFSQNIVKLDKMICLCIFICGIILMVYTGYETLSNW